MSVVQSAEWKEYVALLQRGDADVDVFLAWVTNHKEWVRQGEKDESRNNPLLIGITCTAPEAVLLALIAVWPESVVEKNNYGDTPLHMALEYAAPHTVIAALVAAKPASLETRDMGKDRYVIAAKLI